MGTEVGYAGGSGASPTYHDLDTHAEVLRVDFDPQIINLDEILDRFWAGHDPGREPFSSQYRAILVCGDQAQLERCRASGQRLEREFGLSVHTEIVVARFHPAEAYHQKWRLRQRKELFAEVVGNYANEAEMLASVAATKLNAYVAGNGTRAQLERDIERLGLSVRGRRELDKRTSSRLGLR